MIVDKGVHLLFFSTLSGTKVLTFRLDAHAGYLQGEKECCRETCACYRFIVMKDKTRLKEHKDQAVKSARAEHAWAEDHPIKWNDTKILQHARCTMELVMKEALCI